MHCQMRKYFESEEEDHVDGGAWEGGTYTLGGGGEVHMKD